MSNDTMPERHVPGARLVWRQQRPTRLADDPASHRCGRITADRLMVTNTGGIEATTLTMVVVPLAGALVALHDALEPLDLPPGSSASWALTRTTPAIGRTCVLSIAAYWFEGDHKHAAHWGVPLTGR
ncbi:hypothetical protein [Solicola sp. PLA-1-18]|uniref:hypothetical protein n=1 Tax=Solicola sp. PLA-1-18 TaxID=3380532 RepID=UPI003B7F64AD